MRPRPTTIRLPEDLVRQVDQIAREDIRTRQAQIEHLIRLGLAARERDRAR